MVCSNDTMIYYTAINKYRYRGGLTFPSVVFQVRPARRYDVSIGCITAPAGSGGGRMRAEKGPQDQHHQSYRSPSAPCACSRSRNSRVGLAVPVAISEPQSLSRTRLREYILSADRRRQHMALREFPRQLAAAEGGTRAAPLPADRHAMLVTA